MSLLIKKMFALCAVCMISTVANAATPLQLLQMQEPELFKLYAGNQRYQTGLSDYAARQGFRKPVEQFATVVHELIHIDSAVHAGYFIDGVYYEPYLKPGAWPAMTNAEVEPYMLPQERGNISDLYARNTPQNTLGNVIDEINAYGHVAGFVCRNEPESSEKQTRNLIGHLHLQEAFLRELRLKHQQEYIALSRSRESKGALTTITLKAHAALKLCGISEALIPMAEANYLISLFR